MRYVVGALRWSVYGKNARWAAEGEGKGRGIKRHGGWGSWLAARKGRLQKKKQENAVRLLELLVPLPLCASSSIVPPCLGSKPTAPTPRHALHRRLVLPILFSFRFPLSFSASAVLRVQRWRADGGKRVGGGGTGAAWEDGEGSQQRKRACVRGGQDVRDSHRACLHPRLLFFRFSVDRCLSPPHCHEDCTSPSVVSCRVSTSRMSHPQLFALFFSRFENFSGFLFLLLFVFFLLVGEVSLTAHLFLLLVAPLVTHFVTLFFLRVWRVRC